MDFLDDIDKGLGINNNDTVMVDTNDKLFLMDIQPDSKDKSGVILICKDSHGGTLVVPVTDIKKDVYLLCNENSEYEECIKEVQLLMEEDDEVISNDDFDSLEYCFDNLSGVPKGKSNYIIIRQHYGSRSLTEKRIKRKKCKHIIYSIGYNELIVKSFMVSNKIFGPCYITLNMLGLSIQDNKNEKRSVCENEYKPISMGSPEFELFVYEDEEENTSFDVAMLKMIFMRISYITNYYTRNIEIAAIQCYSNRDERLCFLREIPGISKSMYKHTEQDSIKIYKDEQKLLLEFFEYIKQEDPDILIGHKLNNHDLPLIVNRAIQNNISTKCISYLSRINNHKYKVHGRIMCDLWDFLLLKGNAKSEKGYDKLKSYDLYELAKIFTDMDVPVKSDMSVYEYYVLNRLDVYCELLLTECDIMRQLEAKFNIIELTKLLSQYAGCLWSETLSEGKSVMNEMLLLHKFKEHNLVPPPPDISLKIGNKRSRNRRNMPRYEGGKIFDVTPGYYTGSIYLPDVKSLYPSLCSLLKICFCEDEDDRFLYKVFEDYVEKRNLNRDNPVKQRALKITANALYGVLGMFYFRFGRMDLAEKITGKGREILTTMIEKAIGYGMDVLYGHTDSIMVKIYDAEQFLKFMDEINDMYDDINVKIDGKFQKVLIINKTGYVGFNNNNNTTGDAKFNITGTKIIARDTCLFQTIACNRVLEEIFKYDSIGDIEANKCELVRSINAIVYEIENELESNEIDIENLLVTKKIGTTIKSNINREWVDDTGTPHLSVAKWLHNNGIKVCKDDIVQYLVCKKGNSKKSKLYVPTLQYERESSLLNINHKYYSNDRLRSIIKTICEPITDINKLLFVMKK